MFLVAVLQWNQQQLGRETRDEATSLPLTFPHLNFLICPQVGG